MSTKMLKIKSSRTWEYIAVSFERGRNPTTTTWVRHCVQTALVAHLSSSTCTYLHFLLFCFFWSFAHWKSISNNMLTRRKIPQPRGAQCYIDCTMSVRNGELIKNWRLGNKWWQDQKTNSWQSQWEAKSWNNRILWKVRRLCLSEEDTKDSKAVAITMPCNLWKHDLSNSDQHLRWPRWQYEYKKTENAAPCS